MGRGPKPTKGKAKPTVSRQSPKSDDARVRDLEKRLAEAQEQLRTRDTELVQARQQLKVAHVQATESLEQQAATSEILRVIAGSPTDPQPVFDAILKRSATLCEAQLAHLWLYEGGEQFRLGAGYGSRPDHLQWLQQGLHRFGQPFFRESGPWRVGQVLDVRDTEPYRRGEPLWIRTADHEGMRTLLGVPLVKDGRLVGSIAVYRREVQPFTDHQTALVQTFADQAVIAIENVRLFNETKEALERQTATSEILRVISSSPTDVQPVFEGVLASGVRLCGASFGGVFRFDGELIHLVTSHEWPAEQLKAVYRRFPMPPGDGSLAARAIRDRAVVQTPDYVADSRAGVLPEWVPQGEQRPRSTIAIPMLREGSALGAIVLARAEPGLFSDKHIALLRTFADQAVIAIENVRLFTALEARNRDLTATAEILQVISRSPTDLQPVFDTIVRNAANVCGAFDATLALADGEDFVTPAHHGPIPRRSSKISMRGTVTGLAIREARTVHVADLLAAEDFPIGKDLARKIGYRTVLIVPLLREGVANGAIGIRRTEVRPFTDAQIALLQTFADQAAIAIENVRLFKELEARNNELTDALARQTATSEILRVISSSPTDVRPVFDAIVQSAGRLCDAVFGGLVSFDGELMHLEATHNWSSEAFDLARDIWPAPPSRTTSTGRAILERAVVHVPDLELDREYRTTLSRAAGFRSVLAVPMLRDGVPLGAIAVGRAEPGPFANNQIALLKTFADQAVIAIENVRLFKELGQRNRQLTEALEQQTATSESPEGD
jgi:GAF domain-containing protein